MKTYFKYEGIIKSKEAAEAIAAPSALGPFCGFGSATISGNKVVMSPEGISTNRFANMIKDRIKARYMTKSAEDGELPDVNFGCISRDGYIFISDDSSISIENIQGTQGSSEEVLVFAIHTPIDEPVDNPVEFIACWNESSTDFYTLFKKSLDVYYPIATANRTPDILENDVYMNRDFTYANLLELVESAVPYYANNKASAVLIGIYGRGTDAMTKRTENFSIVPYAGTYQELPFTSATYSLIKESVSNMETLSKGFPVSLDGKNLDIKGYIDAQIELLKKDFSGSLSSSGLPVGSIILWESDEIPDGWAEYTKANGRIVIGFQAGGIQIGTETMLQNVGDYYTPTKGNYEVTINGNDLPRHRHAFGVSIGGQDNANDADNIRPQSFDQRDGNLNGNRGYKGSTNGIQNGALVTSYNLIGESYTNQSSIGSITLEKLPPTITLRYIQKIST